MRLAEAGAGRYGWRSDASGREAAMSATEAEINEAHRAKMARIKAAKDRLYASKTKEKGLLIVHTGTG